MRETLPLTIAAQQFDELAGQLARGDFVIGARRDEKLFDVPVLFSDGRIMDIQVVNSESGPWTQGVLYTPLDDKPCGGAGLGEVGVTEVAEDLAGDYIVEYEGKEYCVLVKREVVTGTFETWEEGAYNTQLNADVQISTEENIATYLSDRLSFNEEGAAEAGRELLKKILHIFRPDLFVKLDTREQRYLAGKGSKCPHCDSKEIENGAHDTDDTIGVTVTCNDCGRGWTDLYTLTGVLIDD